ncbi:energy transducer TonB [Bacteroides sp. 224]|uniref:energy transducer TonB n=1 Tax=Bacteroides sp. 224 TaxID=2302936 RepID=UPI0013D84BDE|nr:energy transducer TonB [Bacteroides sp. 224]NDV64300.1 energy transducer TonB [Bacteroides sp. 224]
MPEFPGGAKELFNYINETLQYPENAAGNNIQGQVVTSFIVQKDGSIKDIKIVRGIKGLNSEAIRIISKMPKWIPGVHQGEVAAVRYTLPIEFKLKIVRKHHPTMKQVMGTNPEAWDKVETMAQYPGGAAALTLFFRENVNYPSKALKEKIEGRVIVEAIIDEKGKVVEPKVIQSVHPLLDKEALRVTKIMPRWKPGMVDGKAIRTRYTFPFSFKVPKE